MPGGFTTTFDRSSFRASRPHHRRGPRRLCLRQTGTTKRDRFDGPGTLASLRRNAQVTAGSQRGLWNFENIGTELSLDGGGDASGDGPGERAPDHCSGAQAPGKVAGMGSRLVCGHPQQVSMAIYAPLAQIVARARLGLCPYEPSRSDWPGGTDDRGVRMVWQVFRCVRPAIASPALLALRGPPQLERLQWDAGERTALLEVARSIQGNRWRGLPFRDVASRNQLPRVVEAALYSASSSSSLRGRPAWWKRMRYHQRSPSSMGMNQAGPGRPDASALSAPARPRASSHRAGCCAVVVCYLLRSRRAEMRACRTSVSLAEKAAPLSASRCTPAGRPCLNTVAAWVPDRCEKVRTCAIVDAFQRLLVIASRCT